MDVCIKASFVGRPAQGRGRLGSKAELQGGAALDAKTPMTTKRVTTASSDSTDLEDDPDLAVVS